MIVIIAGAGASFAVSEEYLTTVQFSKKLPTALKKNPVIASFFRAVEKGAVFPDIEMVLGRIQELRTNLGTVADFRVINELLAGAPAPAEKVLQFCRALSANHVPPVLGLFGGLNDGIRRRMWEIYSRRPEESELATTWVRLLNVLASQSKDVEIYSLNYDRVLESALERLSPRVEQDYLLHDGIVKEYGASHVATDAWDRSPDELRKGKAGYILFTKLHGSLNWTRDDEEGVVVGGWRTPPEDLDRACLVYPVLGKDASREEPFRKFYGRLKTMLKSAECVISIGYAHRDPAIERLLAARTDHPLLLVNPDEDLELTLRTREGHPLPNAIRIAPLFDNSLPVSLDPELKKLRL